MIEPSPNTLKYAPWSISKAETAELCPYKFNKSYVDKPAIRAAPNAVALIGKTVHLALEYLLQGQTVERALRFATDKFQLTSEEAETVLSFSPNLHMFNTRFSLYRKNVGGLKPSLEEKLGVTVDWKPTKFFGDDVFMRGVIDLSMEINAKPHTIIIDHKTGKVRELEHYEAQFDAYMLLKKAQRPNLNGIVVGINFIKDDLIAIRKKPQLLNDVRDIEPLGDKVMLFLNKASSNLDDLNVTRKTPLCGWCDHREICPAFKDVEGSSNGCKKETQHGNIESKSTEDMGSATHGSVAKSRRRVPKKSPI